MSRCELSNLTVDAHGGESSARRACAAPAPSQPCAMVIFGATGDLTHRKLLPALYNLALEQPLPPQFTRGRRGAPPLQHEQFRQQAMESVNQFSRRRPVNPAVWETFGKGLFYCQSSSTIPMATRPGGTA